MMRNRKFLRLSGPVLGLLVLLVAAGCGGGGGSDGGGAGAPPPTGSIHGIVTIEELNLSPGDPGGLLVYVKEHPHVSTRTSPGGAYTLSGVPVGSQTVVLEPPPDPPDGLYVVEPPGGHWQRVVVLADLSTFNVNFRIEAVPAPPQWE